MDKWTWFLNTFSCRFTIPIFVCLSLAPNAFWVLSNVWKTSIFCFGLNPVIEQTLRLIRFWIGPIDQCFILSFPTYFIYSRLIWFYHCILAVRIPDHWYYLLGCHIVIPLSTQWHIRQNQRDHRIELNCIALQVWCWLSWLVCK